VTKTQNINLGTVVSLAKTTLINQLHKKNETIRL